VIGRELRREERIGMARDEREQRSAEDEDEGGDRERNQAAEPCWAGSR